MLRLNEDAGANSGKLAEAALWSGIRGAGAEKFNIQEDGFVFGGTEPQDKIP